MELSTYAGDFRAFKALITAQVAGVSVAVKEVDAKGSSPNSVPVLSTPNGAITQSNAIARYIARSRPEAGLYGQTFFQSGQVDSWIDWGTNNAPSVLELWGIEQLHPHLSVQPVRLAVTPKKKTVA